MENIWKPKVGDWFILKSSYCGDSPDCSEDEPCDDCLKMCNKFVISSEHCGRNFFFGGGWCNRDGGCVMDSTYSAMLTTDRNEVDGIRGIHHISEALPIPSPIEIILNTKYDELKSEFVNLLNNYWYAIRTRDCTILPMEREKEEDYAKKLMVKWGIV